MVAVLAAAIFGFYRKFTNYLAEVCQKFKNLDEIRLYSREQIQGASV
jgi:hypothetical protein